MYKPSKEEMYDFINHELRKLRINESTTVIMQGRVYKVKFRGDEEDLYPEHSEVKANGNPA